MAAVCCASTSRRAMVARRLVMRSRVSPRAPGRVPGGGPVRRRCRRLRGGLAAPSSPGVSARAEAGVAARSTSPLVTRGPLAGTALELHVVSLRDVAGRRRGADVGRAGLGRRRWSGLPVGGCGRFRCRSRAGAVVEHREHFAHLDVGALVVRRWTAARPRDRRSLRGRSSRFRARRAARRRRRGRPPSSATSPRALRRPTRPVRAPRCFGIIGPSVSSGNLFRQHAIEFPGFGRASARTPDRRWRAGWPRARRTTLPTGSSCGPGRCSAAATARR